jgi:lycopene cyclase domain-containing protein
MDLFNSKYFYFIVLAITIGYPILQSFEKRIKFYKSWSVLFPSIILMSFMHIPIDIIFTKIGVWSFNHEFVYGYFIAGLPVEEWLFFIIIPFSCLFLYKVIKYFFNPSPPTPLLYYLTFFTGIILIVLAIVFFESIYTSFYFSMAGATLIIIHLTKPAWWKDFLFMYLIALIPFLIINGFLTGSFTNNAVVVYNEAHILGIRILNIPIEDMVYCFQILVTVVAIYEFGVRSVKSLPVKDN